MLTGTLVNYYIHCKRQCWLFYHKLNMEDNSEDVRIGRVLHALQTAKEPEFALENIKLDKISNGYVVEIKKSDADLEAALAQVQFYLMTLKIKGLEYKGRIEVLEKNKQDKKIHITELTEDLYQKLLLQYQEIENFLKNQKPPEAIRKASCKKCAYFEFCFI